jgi:hypothetical protein
MAGGAAGELDLRAGRVDAATGQLEHAWALACHLDDPCWEGMAARGPALAPLLDGHQGAARTGLAAGSAS